MYCQDWTNGLREHSKLCADAHRHKENSKKTGYQRAQMAAQELYASTVMQSCVALLIVANFVVRIVDVEMLPEPGTEYSNTLEQVDFMFTLVFAAELLINMFANWTFMDNCFVPGFFLDGWNIFDFFVVSISILSLLLQDVPGISILRLMRVFRVLRLFPRLQSLRMIINALTSAILPCANAFMVLLLFTCIYAVVAVTLFKVRLAPFSVLLPCVLSGICLHSSLLCRIPVFSA